MTVANLPKVLYLIEKVDSGEYGAAHCPHCGAEGRYTYIFMTEQGSMGAMAGCFKLFPKSILATEAQRIMDKEKRYQKEGWALPSWDQAIIESIRSFTAGEITMEVARGQIGDQKFRAAQYRQNRGRR